MPQGGKSRGGTTLAYSTRSAKPPYARQMRKSFAKTLTAMADFHASVLSGCASRRTHQSSTALNNRKELRHAAPVSPSRQRQLERRGRSSEILGGVARLQTISTRGKSRLRLKSGPATGNHVHPPPLPLGLLGYAPIYLYTNMLAYKQLGIFYLPPPLSLARSIPTTINKCHSGERGARTGMSRWGQYLKDIRNGRGFGKWVPQK